MELERNIDKRWIETHHDFYICYNICMSSQIYRCLFRELDDIMRGRQILVDLIERNALPVFKDINTALKCSAHVLQKVRSARFSQCQTTC